MKTLFLTTVLFFGITASVCGQSDIRVAVSKSKSELAQSKTNGKYIFSLPTGTPSDKVEQNAKYYTNYFTVTYSSTTSVANITMITNDEKSRHIICRFLIACGIEKINVEGTDLAIEEFFTSYLK